MKSVLIVRLGSLGDVVHAIPAAAALRAAFPIARIDWATHPSYLPLLDLVPLIDNRIGVDTREVVTSTRPGGQPLTSAVRALRRVGYEVVLDLQGLLKSAALARAVGASRTVGFPREQLREPLARMFYTETPDPGGATHVIQKNLGLLAAFGVADRTVRFPMRVPESSSVSSAVRTIGAEGFVLLNPGAAWPNKRWPPARFGAVAQALHRTRGLRSLVLWGPGEERLAEDVVSAAGGAARVSPATTIPEMAALARAARLMISGDTGPLHLAGAMGTPIVALFGPTRTERNGPWGAADISISRVHACDCVYERTCRRAVPCIDDIAVEEVVGAAERRLEARTVQGGVS